MAQNNPQALRAGLLFTNFFLIILAYYQVKPASRSLILDYLPAANLPYVWIASASLLLVLAPFYQWLVARTQRLYIVIGACLLFSALLMLFKLLLKTPSMPVAVGLYLLVDVLSVVLVEQLWSLTNSGHRSDEGRRWYWLIGSGGLLGGLVGGTSASWLIKHTPLTTADLLLVGAAMIIATLALTLLIGRMGLYKEQAEQAAQTSWRVFKQHKYLIFIAGLLLLSQMVGPIIEFQFMSVVEQAFPERESRTVYLSSFFATLSLIALTINFTITPILLKRMGAIAGLSVQPLVIMFTSLLFSFYGGIMSAAAMKIGDRGLSYSLNRAARELLYIPIHPVTIYRAKAWIDMVGYRAFKLLGSAVILFMTQWLPGITGVGLGVQGMTAVVILICLMWIGLLAYMRKDYQKLLDNEERNLAAYRPV